MATHGASACAQSRLPIAAFSTFAPGTALPPGWREVPIPQAKRPAFTLVADEGRTVLRVRSEAAAGSLAHDLAAEPAAAGWLAWRWKVDRVLQRAAWGAKSGDDFAARVYVTFELPHEALPFVDRAKLALARALHGEDLPTAALCYVWAAREPVGTTGWNPYTDRVRMVVLRSGGEQAGRWLDERRDLEADFRAAFGAQWSGPTPRITGVLLAADTDQTGESVTAWFGDVRLEPGK